MKVSASVFVSNEPLKYAKELELTGVDYFHIDLVENNNGLLKLNKLHSFDRIQIPLDIHLIFSTINKDIITQLNNLNTEILSVQYENLVNVDMSIDNLKKLHKGFGFAILPNTNIDVLNPYRNMMKHILIMSSIPGVSGASFLEESYDFVKEIKLQFPELPIYVDGGINGEICKIMNDNGVSMSVFGSYLYKNKNNLYEIISELKNSEKILL